MSIRADGVTPTERYLTRLARRSFLRLWSYPGLYRDQGVGKRGEGAELCDLLVVFERDVLIFSDKDCAFPDVEDVDVAWRRWYKRAILKSAQQTWGAERWLREHPQRVFVDRACQRPIPIALPDPAHARYHRIVIAHDTTGRRRQLTGGSGSLLVNPSIRGEEHFLGQREGGHPFAVGFVDPERPYVHVFDDVSLDIVLGSLDTVTDFLWYLQRKEALLASGRLHGAFGEEDLLAFYLKHTNPSGDHDFVLPDGATKVLLEEGHWADYVRRDGVRLKRRADKVSYSWDELIDHVSRDALAGTLRSTNHATVADQERGLRALAREPRIRRRLLARSLVERVTNPPPPGRASFRTILPSFLGDPHYVFVVISPRTGVEPGSAQFERYRDHRRDLLGLYTTAAMGHFENAVGVVGIATEGVDGPGRSFDVVMMLREGWSEQADADAKLLKMEYGWFQELRYSDGIEEEYPASTRPPGRVFRSLVHKTKRNDPCPCGSGKKYKRCHGATGPVR